MSKVVIAKKNNDKTIFYFYNKQNGIIGMVAGFHSIVADFYSATIFQD